VGSDGHHYYSRRYNRTRWNGGDRGIAAVIGGVLGAAVGGAIASGSC
jgi:hypothetical protein